VVASSSPENRFERRRRRNREALLEAAIELFQERGLRATKLEDVCARADVAPRTFFNHFETREHLYRAIAGRRAEQLVAVLDARTADDRPFDERLRTLLAEIAHYLAERPAYRELVREMLYLPVESGSATARVGSLGRAALRFVSDGVARGEISRRHAPEVLADLLLGALVTALTNWCADEDYDLVGALAQSGRALLDLFDPVRDRSTPT
jgi:AcrR family transcriptional regulator